MLAVAAADEACAVEVARRLGLPQLATGTDPTCSTESVAVLLVSGPTLRLQQTGGGAPGSVGVDFGSPGMRHRRHAGTRELLGRAVGQGRKSPLRIVDATAGLGRDSFVLADLGCEVLLCEREPVIAELLRSGLHCAAVSNDPWLTGVVQRMALCPGSAESLSVSAMEDADVIYLDPMFPPRRKSAAVKKEMALLQALLAPFENPTDADALLRWAVRQDVARVVVKRPAKAPALEVLQPSHCIRGSAVRYDVYVLRKLL